MISWGGSQGGSQSERVGVVPVVPGTTLALFQVSDRGENGCASEPMPVVAEEPHGVVTTDIGMGS